MGELFQGDLAPKKATTGSQQQIQMFRMENLQQADGMQSQLHRERVLLQGSCFFIFGQEKTGMQALVALSYFIFGREETGIQALVALSYTAS